MPGRAYAKTKKLYTPYILTCIGMATMYYIIAFLSKNTILDYMRVGGTLQTILGLGSWIIASNEGPASNVTDYHIGKITALLQDGQIDADIKAMQAFDVETYNNIRQLYFMPLSDYNRLMRTNEKLQLRARLSYN